MRKNRGRPKVHDRRFDADFEAVFTDVEVIEGLLEIASHDWLRGLDVTPHRYTVGLDRIGSRIVCRDVEQVFLNTLATIWESGWQPAEVVRQCKRKAEAPAVRLLQLAIAVDHGGRPVEGPPPRRNWRSTSVGAAPNTDWQALIEVLGVMKLLDPIQILLPTPGGGCLDLLVCDNPLTVPSRRLEPQSTVSAGAPTDAGDVRGP